MVGYLRQDNDGHWFVVPEDELYAFEEWLDSGCNEEYNCSYQDLRIDSPFNEKVIYGTRHIENIIKLIKV